MRRYAGFGAILAVALLAGCSGSSGGGSTPSATPTDPVTSSSAPPTSPVASSSTTHPPTPVSAPTVPADVPRTGVNVRPGERPPVEPLAALQHTPAGAKAFAKFFVQTVDWGFATQSAAYLRHYAATTCTSCTSFNLTFASLREKHQTYIGGRLSIVGVRSNADAMSSIGVTVNIASFEVLDADRKVVQGDKPHDGVRFGVQLAWIDSAWRVRQLEVN